MRNVTEDEEPCGKCSYQQSCGRKCHRRGTGGKVNQFFVAERLCSARQIRGNEQDTACVAQDINNCAIWPNPDIP
uniref:Uncharacterized protein n=1 Tax=Plectus sambesii TaxID=2011161 RepID=A0A914VMB7_9BILA